jgi:hypothetical protein
MIALKEDISKPFSLNNKKEENPFAFSFSFSLSFLRLLDNRIQNLLWLVEWFERY